VDPKQISVKNKSNTFPELVKSDWKLNYAEVLSLIVVLYLVIEND